MQISEGPEKRKRRNIFGKIHTKAKKKLMMTSGSIVAPTRTGEGAFVLP